MPRSTAYYRAKALQCRRLAASLYDKDATRILLEFAEEFDARAKNAEAYTGDKSRRHGSE